MNRRIAKKIVNQFTSQDGYRGKYTNDQLHAAFRIMGADASKDILYRPSEEPEPTPTPSISLASLTVPQLKEKAKQAGITGYSKLKKADLVAALGEK